MCPGSRRPIRGCLIIAAALLIHSESICAASPAAPTRQVRRIRSWTAPDHTRVVLDMSSRSAYTSRVLDNPHRIVIDIPSGSLASGVSAVEVNDGVISRIRVNKLKSGAQIVLDLPQKSTFRDFALDPNKELPHRIVIDVDRILSKKEQEEKIEQVKTVTGSGDVVVIVDPGHGGSMPGACSKNGIREKDIALEISRMIAGEIDSNKGFKAVLTRDGDYDVGLGKRVAIARDFGGACVVSVHVNAMDPSRNSSKIRGSEVWFLDLEGARDENAETVAERENMIAEMGDEAEDLGDLAKFILTDMGRYQDMERSARLAERIGSQLRKNGHIPFRSVKQDNFVVLRGLQRPSVLVEVAYLSNPRDAELITKKNVQQEMAANIAAGIVDYLKENPPPENGNIPRQTITHIVVEGETLWGIARQYGLSVADILDINGMSENSGLKSGQELKIIRRPEARPQQTDKR